MERAKQSLAFLPIAFAFLLCFVACTESRTVAIANGQKQPADEGAQYTWCIAKPSTDEIKLTDNIEYSCKQPGVDCSIIAANGVCYYPNNVVSHASVAMNLYYKAAGKHHWDCYFSGTGLIIDLDPTDSACVYPL